MLHHYIMVLNSLIAVLLLVLFILFYSKIFPRKNISRLLLLILISCLPLVSLLRNGTYESGDLSLHVSFAIPFFESLKEGVLFPTWNQYVLNGYGYPLYLFVYPLPYYLASVLHFVGISFISGFKLIGALSFMFSGIGMYLYVKEEFKNEISAFIAAIFYLFAPYHLVDMHFRFSIGEILAFAILPYCMYFIKKVRLKNKYIFSLLLCISSSLLILSHQAISLLAYFLFFIYTLFLWFIEKENKLFWIRSMSLMIGVLFSAFYWMPLLIESKYTSLFSLGPSFPSIFSLIFSTSRFGLLFQGNRGELFFPIGYVHLPLLIFSVLVIISKKIKLKMYENYLYLFYIIACIVSIFMMTSVSKPIWQSIPLLSGFQFAYRFSLFTAFFSSFIAGLIIGKIKNINIIYLIISVTILITVLNWGNRRTIPEINDYVLKQELYSSLDSVGYGKPIWIKSLEPHDRKNNIEIIRGKAEIKEVIRTTQNHQYLIDVNSPNATIRDNTLYFHDWNIEANGKNISEDLTTGNGLIVFKLKKGLYFINIAYHDTEIRHISRYLSILSIIIAFSVYVQLRNIRI